MIGIEERVYDEAYCRGMAVAKQGAGRHYQSHLLSGEPGDTQEEGKDDRRGHCGASRGPKRRDMEGTAVYTWGVGHSGELGNGRLDNRKQCPVPAPVRFAARIRERITAVAAGEGFTAALGASGAVFTWGKGNKLGHGDGQDLDRPRRVSALWDSGWRARRVSAGDMHMGVACDHAKLGRRGRAFLWGNGCGGCLGDGDVSPHYQLTPFPSPFEDYTTTAAASTMVIETNAGGAGGGADKAKRFLASPGDITGQAVASLVVAEISCGLRTTGVITVHSGDGEGASKDAGGWVYTWGDSAKGKLGRGGGARGGEGGGGEASYKAAGGSADSCSSSAESSREPGKLRLDRYGAEDDDNGDAKCDDGEEGKHAVRRRVFVSLSMGSWHGAAVTACGELWTWGYGKWGNLGHGDRKSTSIARRVQFPAVVGDVVHHHALFPGEEERGRRYHVVGAHTTVGMCTPVAGPGAEGLHTLAWTRDGTVFAFGTGHKGQLGNLRNKWGFHLQGREDELLPYRVGSLRYRDNDGDTGGGHGGGNTGHRPSIKDVGAADDDASSSPSTAPPPAPFDSQTEIVGAVASSIHSGMISADGQIFTLGCGSNGRCGLDAYLTGCGGHRQVHKFYVSRPSPVEELYRVGRSSGMRAVQLATSRRHMVALLHVDGGHS